MSALWISFNQCWFSNRVIYHQSINELNEQFRKFHINVYFARKISEYSKELVGNIISMNIIMICPIKTHFFKWYNMLIVSEQKRTIFCVCLSTRRVLAPMWILNRHHFDYSLNIHQSFQLIEYFLNNIKNISSVFGNMHRQWFAKWCPDEVRFFVFYISCCCTLL